jgi:hypothetical protein
MLTKVSRAKTVYWAVGNSETSMYAVERDYCCNIAISLIDLIAGVVFGAVIHSTPGFFPMRSERLLPTPAAHFEQFPNGLVLTR